MESRSKETESDNEASAENYEPDVKFEPVISLPLVNHVTLEEDESTLIKLLVKILTKVIIQFLIKKSNLRIYM